MSNKQQLALYYKWVFPFKPYTRWLAYDRKSAEYFSYREFAFILEDDVHLRYRTFTDAAEFERELCKVNPEKLDLGAIYNYRPNEHKRWADFKAIERELVFDIDLTDYDDVRTCCNDARVCTKCWRFVALAVKVLDRLLEIEFGFKARLWVFSGRRGVHCWVGDEKARKLTANARTAIAEHLSLVQGSKVEPGKSKKGRTFVHPVFDEAYRTMLDSPEFEALVVEQGWLSDAELPKLLDSIKDIDLKDNVKSVLSQLSEKSPQRLKALQRFFDRKLRGDLAQQGTKLPSVDFNDPEVALFLRRFVLHHAYPRLDVNVSTGVNHLLKSPFCVHPKTGCVAVPLEVSSVEKFNPLEAPTVAKLNKEIAQAVEADETKENRKLLGYRHTSLAPFVTTFEKFVEKLSSAKSG